MRAMKSELEKRHRSLRRAIDRSRGARDANVDLEASKDPFGAASITHDRELAAAVVERRIRELREVTQALETIESGRYGICRACGEPIPRARLKVLPFAIRCVPCQAKFERAEAAS